MNMEKTATHGLCYAGVVIVKVCVCVCVRGVAEVSGCPLREKKVPITGGL